MAKRKPGTRRRNYGRGHGYYIDGTEVNGRGVTTIIKGGYPSPALVYWAGRSVATAAVDERDIWEPLAARSRDAAIDYLKEAPWRQRDEAAASGTEVHRYAERLAAGETVEVPDELLAKVDAYLDFREDWHPTDELIERMVVNRRHVYAGTFDAIATFADWPRPDGTRGPARVLYDIKTGRGVYPDVALQLAAYRYAETMLEPDGEAGEEPMPAVDDVAVLHLTEDGYQLIPVDAGPDAFRLFLYVSQIAQARGTKSKPGPLEGWLKDPITPTTEEG